MSQRSTIHFEISERKILLRIIDVCVVLISVHLVGVIFGWTYFMINLNKWIWFVTLGFYVLFSATVFELYDLQKASRIMSSLRGVGYTATLASLAYLLTPYVTPALPSNRIEVFYFFLTVMLSLMGWRAIYIKLFASSLFYKRIIIVADAIDAVEIADSLKAADPNFYVDGYINTDSSIDIGHDDRLPALSLEQAMEKLSTQEVSEIVMASANVEGITPQIYAWLINLVENGFSVREYTQVYEEMTDRVPVTFVGKDFYRYFPFARSNQNRLYKSITAYLM